jgi:glycosyltransferase involved in cell wall biosynthesis
MVWGYRTLRDSCLAVTENEFGAREYESFGVKREKIAFVPLFFPVEEYASLPAAGGFCDRHHIKEKYIIMSLGRIHRIKGLDFLVDSFYESSKLRSDVILVLVGSDDGFKSRLEEQIARLGLSDKVRFAGFLSGQDKLSALVDASIVVQPSRYEQAAWAPIEAVMCGTPIIVTKGSGSGEDVARMGAGYQVEYGNKLQMVATIQSVLDNPADAKAKVHAAIDYIKTNLTLSKKVSEYDSIYQECMEKSGRKGE